MKRVEALLFCDELELFHARLREGDDIVDEWVIVEAAETFTGLAKPLHFAEHRDEFGPWLDRIRHLVVDLPAGGPWKREHASRAALGPILDELAADDVVAFCDADELLAATAWEQVDGPLMLDVAQRYYSLRWESSVRDCRTRIAPRSAVADVVDWMHWPAPRAIGDGWHLSCLGGVERVARKLASFSHTELAADGWTEPANVARLITGGVDPGRRPDVTLTLTEPDGPAWLLDEGVRRWPWLLDPLTVEVPA